MTYRPSLYLAGPIFGCTEGEAKDWRHYVADRLPWVRCISPLRCEPMIGARYDVAYNDPRFGMPKSIVAKNFLDLRACDMTLAYFPTPPEVAELQGIIERLSTLENVATDMFGQLDDDAASIRADIETLKRHARKGPQRSVGTIGEVSWAYALRKPCVLVSDDPFITVHPFTSVQPDWPVLASLDEAIEVVAGIWRDYAA
ncbi:hypothetical protein [Bradyrhizobium sp. SZCCHNS2015]|uniref:hypothetical protein n=1 Tax=Bradyrhizobium sp. SZCCHNS2015 TaxID=3057305 RepID=UPI0028E39F04|nr:hypothetical protein [Bradyrhizobium sp. SZCCHNS2015]